MHVSVLTLYELGYGLANAPEDKKAKVREQLEKIPQDFSLLPLSSEGAELFGILKKSLQTNRGLNSKQMRRHNIDLMLAASAIVSNGVLVSADQGFVELKDLHTHFRREDWTK